MESMRELKMHTPTGEIHHITEAEAKEFERGINGSERGFSTERKMVELSDEEAKSCESMPRYQRKGWMRNKPCHCGSKKKFKNCCWSKFS